MIFVKNSKGGREVNMINTLSKIGWEGGGSTSIWMMSANILLLFFDGTPKEYIFWWVGAVFKDFKPWFMNKFISLLIISSIYSKTCSVFQLSLPSPSKFHHIIILMVPPPSYIFVVQFPFWDEIKSFISCHVDSSIYYWVHICSSL